MYFIVKTELLPNEKAFDVVEDLSEVKDFHHLEIFNHTQYGLEKLINRYGRFLNKADKINLMLEKF